MTGGIGAACGRDDTPSETWKGRAVNAKVLEQKHPTGARRALPRAARKLPRGHARPKQVHNTHWAS
eukprot:1170628-Pyramimonas_sp.AAC.1